MKISPGDSPSRRALADRRILISDRNDAVAIDLADLLRRSGCDVVGPTTTSEASIALVGRERLDGAIVSFELRDRDAHILMGALWVRRIPFLLTAAERAPAQLPNARPYLTMQSPLVLSQVQSALAHMFGSGHS